MQTESCLTPISVGIEIFSMLIAGMMVSKYTVQSATTIF